MGLAIDGHVTGTWTSGTSFASAGLATANGNDLIAAVVVTSGGQLRTVTSLTTTGVTWNGSARIRDSSGSRGCELWYGKALFPLATQVTTINLSGAPSVGASVNVFGVSGANLGQISDSNVSLPGHTSSGASTIPTISGISTSHANDMIIAACSSGGAVTETAGAGFTLINAINNTSASLGSQQKIVSATQSGITVAFGTSAVNNWVILVDAIQAALDPYPNPDSSADLLVSQNNIIRPVGYY